MESVLFAIIGNIAELAAERPQFCFGVVLIKFVSASDLENATINVSSSTLINTDLE